MSKKLTTDDFRLRLQAVHGDSFDILSEYVNNSTKIKLKCKKCGSIIMKIPSKMVTSSTEGCYVCSGKNRYKTTESLQAEVDGLYPSSFTILGEYKGSRTKLSVLRHKCGHIYDITPDNLLRGKGCPRCSIRQSHYMDIVERYFLSNNIKFEKEKRFQGCRNDRPLPFDYYIPDMNICIEVDGEFHFRENSIYTNKHASYERILKRDEIKTRFCLDNGIKLIRLPYYLESDFEKILDIELHVNTEITS